MNRKLPQLVAQNQFSPGNPVADVIATFQDSKGNLATIKGPYSKTLGKLKTTFSGGAEAVEFVRFGGESSSESVLFVGLGKTERLTTDIIRKAGAAVSKVLHAKKVKAAAIDLDSLLSQLGKRAKISEEEALRAYAEGIVLPIYDFNHHKVSTLAKKVNSNPEKVSFIIKKSSLRTKADGILKRVMMAVECMNITRDWSNEPSNIGNPSYYASEAKKWAQKLGLKCKIIGEAEAKKEKMELFLSVGAGSDREGKIVVLEYNPKKKAKGSKTVVLVGKGITFDSGGYSLKPAVGMWEMKHDMTGAATQMGAIALASKLKVSHRVVAILGFTENLINGSATHPGNVIKSRSGQTVEIDNTDAEGRLILADMLDYADKFKPDVIVDAATLTGACGIALGNRCAGLMGNDQAIMDQIRDISNKNHERVWQLPMYDDYLEDMKSEVADIKNISHGRLAGTILAGKFLEKFVKKGTPWAHLDIAYTGYNCGHVPYYPKKGATGQHVRSIAQFIEEF